MLEQDLAREHYLLLT